MLNVRLLPHCLKFSEMNVILVYIGKVMKRAKVRHMRRNFFTSLVLENSSLKTKVLEHPFWKLQHSFLLRVLKVTLISFSEGKDTGLSVLFPVVS